MLSVRQHALFWKVVLRLIDNLTPTPCTCKLTSDGCVEHHKAAHQTATFDEVVGEFCAGQRTHVHPSADFISFEEH